MGIQDFMDAQRIAVKRIAIGVGVDQRGQPVTASFAAGPNLAIFVVPGKLCTIEVTKPDGKKTIRETPISPFGWEYDVL